MFKIFFFIFILISILTGCASVPSFKNESVTTPSKKGGGYYLDDGPGDNPPENIDAIPDAIPKVEPFYARANQPYMALDNKYTPMTSFYPYKEKGVASWYGKRYHGKKTSVGEIYDMYGMTGAHTTLPIPCYVRVTNTENGKSVIVRINDRGPFKKDRVIDLSFAAAYKLRLSDKGSGPVEVELIDPRQFNALKKTPDIIDEKIKEKEVISEYSLNGIHWWKHGIDFSQSVSKMMENNDTVNGEYYIGPSYSYLEGTKRVYNISSKEHYAVGTLEDIQQYRSLYGS